MSSTQIPRIRRVNATPSASGFTDPKSSTASPLASPGCPEKNSDWFEPNPIANPAIANQIRMRARGDGHRRRISQAQQSRSSVYETIEEEMPSPGPELVQQSPMSLQASPTPMSSMPSLMSLQQSSN
ncbi:hypothetical protein C8J56DRAFT_1052701 [Mycena floridula]|nr:hypothetical protein C8J56DRAFT_1052701 [Mycena floridula]